MLLCVNGLGGLFEEIDARLCNGLHSWAVAVAGAPRSRRFAPASESDRTSNPGPVQKLKVACRSRRRLAAELGEKGPPCRALETSNRREPRTEFGLATLRLLKTLRTLTPNIRL